MADETKVYTPEEIEAIKNEALNKYKWDQEAGIQKLTNDAKFKDEVIDSIGKVAWDAKALVSIFETNPKVAQEILNKYYWGQSIEDYKKSIWFEEDSSVVTDKQITERAKSIVAEEKIKDKKKEFIEKFGLKGEELESFENEFSERLQMKSFDIDKLDEHLIKAYKLATGYSEQEVQNVKKSKTIASVAWVQGGDKSKEGEKTRIQSEVNDFLDTFA